MMSIEKDMTCPTEQFLPAGAQYSNISLEENCLFVSSIAAKTQRIDPDFHGKISQMALQIIILSLGFSPCSFPFLL